MRGDVILGTKLYIGIFLGIILSIVCIFFLSNSL